MSEATDKLAAESAKYARIAARVSNALDGCGIGHDVQSFACVSEDDIGVFIGKVSTGIHQQLWHDLLTNVPHGIVKRDEVTAHAIQTGVIHAISEHLHWDCIQVMEFCADLMEDSNMHPESAELHRQAERMK